MVAPPTQHARIEVAKAFLTLVAQEEGDHSLRRNELSTLSPNLTDLAQLLSGKSADYVSPPGLGFRKYDPNQPRVPKGNRDGGEWTRESAGSNTQSRNQKNSLRIAARISPGREAECEAQFKMDNFHCSMVGLPACYAQAMLRYSNCLRGLPIPPLIYM